MNRGPVQSKATKTLQERGLALVDMTKSEGWTVVRQMIWAKINDLQSIMNLDTADADAMVVDAKARVIAIQTLKEWMTLVEGDVSQYENNFEDEIATDDYIITDED